MIFPTVIVPPLDEDDCGLFVNSKVPTVSQCYAFSANWSRQSSTSLGFLSLNSPLQIISTTCLLCGVKRS